MVEVVEVEATMTMMTRSSTSGAVRLNPPTISSVSADGEIKATGPRERPRTKKSGVVCRVLLGRRPTSRARGRRAVAVTLGKVSLSVLGVDYWRAGACKNADRAPLRGGCGVAGVRVAYGWRRGKFATHTKERAGAPGRVRSLEIRYPLPHEAQLLAVAGMGCSPRSPRRARSLGLIRDHDCTATAPL